MKYDYSKLLGRIKELKHTQASIAEIIGINKSTLSVKLHGKYPFTVKEIDALCKLLDISSDEIGEYFFAK